MCAAFIGSAVAATVAQKYAIEYSVSGSVMPNRSSGVISGCVRVDLGDVEHAAAGRRRGWPAGS